MKSELKASFQEVLAGLVERVTFHNEENGFCVLRTKARGHRDLVTVVGQAATISAGEWITASGEWINDRTHGLQYRARFLKTSPPTSVEGIEKYLGAGMVRGIGPVYARKLVQTLAGRADPLALQQREVLAQGSAEFPVCAGYEGNGVPNPYGLSLFG
jgi:exodeoxyribonuclease V alpha subunit